MWKRKREKGDYSEKIRQVMGRRRMVLPHPHQEALGGPMPGPACSSHGDATAGSHKRNCSLEQ